MSVVPPTERGRRPIEPIKRTLQTMNHSKLNRRSKTAAWPRPSPVSPSSAGLTELALADEDNGSEKGEARTQNRNERARQRTRQKLVEAAYRVMSRVGVEATTVNQITEEADVGFGSFYNYFTSKEEIARAVFHEQIASLSDRMDRINVGIEDPSVRLSRNIRRILLKARRDPVWGWFFLHAEFALHELRSVFWDANLRNLDQGLQQKRYRFRTSATTVANILFGATLSVMRAILEMRASPTVETETVELFMTLLGVPAERARKLATQALPEDAT